MEFVYVTTTPPWTGDAYWDRTVLGQNQPDGAGCMVIGFGLFANHITDIPVVVQR
jgi:hypothetical protein